MKKIILMFTIFFGFSYASIVEANPFGNIKNPLSAITGGDEAEEEAPTLNIDEAQAQLIISLQSALSDVLKAQAMIEEANGNKEKAAELNNTANNISCSIFLSLNSAISYPYFFFFKFATPPNP